MRELVDGSFTSFIDEIVDINQMHAMTGEDARNLSKDLLQTLRISISGRWIRRQAYNTSGRLRRSE